MSWWPDDVFFDAYEDKPVYEQGGPASQGTIDRVRNEVAQERAQERERWNINRQFELDRRNPYRTRNFYRRRALSRRMTAVCKTCSFRFDLNRNALSHEYCNNCVLTFDDEFGDPEQYIFD